jgi:hypothetical protein
MNSKIGKVILKDQSVYWVLVLILLLSKTLNLIEFGFQFTGSDDLIFWISGVDYAKGIFHEPFFYGQNYNFALEALFSVPLIWVGLPAQYALPITSCFIGVFPFLAFAHVLFRKHKHIPAFIFLIIPITLPVEYDLITSMSRGFVTGLFFSSFLVYPILEPKRTRSFIILGFSISLGFVLNPNSLIISFPVSLFLLLHNYKNWKFYVIPLIIGIPFLFLQELAKQFYELNADYKVHFMWILEYDWELLQAAFGNLNQYFRYLMPVFWTGHWVVILLILFTGFYLIKKDWRKGLSLILSIVFAIVLLGLNKISDDMGKIFLSSTRMYLAVPILLGLSFFWVKEEFKYKKEWKLVLVTLALSFFFVKVAILPQVVDKHTSINNLGPVGVKKLSQLELECEELKEITTKHKVDLVVFVPKTDEYLPRVEFYNYGCKVLLEGMTPSVMNIYERRTWVYQEERKSARKTVLLFNCTLKNVEILQKEMDIEVLGKFPNLILVRNNDKTLSELCDLFGIRCQRNSYY